MVRVLQNLLCHAAELFHVNSAVHVGVHLHTSPLSHVKDAHGRHNDADTSPPLTLGKTTGASSASGIAVSGSSSSSLSLSSSGCSAMACLPFGCRMRGQLTGRRLRFGARAGVVVAATGVGSG